MNTATLTALEARHTWFAELDAESRSWINVLARGGIDGFVNWVSGSAFSFESVFDSAPRALAGRISLRQTVDLVRTTTDVVEEQIQLLLPRADQQPLQLGIVHYSREIAFVAAAVYARAAEARGAWDSRIEATIVDAVVRAEADESVTSRASTLGWDSEAPTIVVMAGAPKDPRVDELRRASARLSLDVLAAPQGERLVCIFAGEVLTDPARACALVTKLEPHFAPGPIVIGPLAEGLRGAPTSARSAASGYRAARAWPEGPRTLLSHDLLPERALAGDGHARRTLARDIFGLLKGAKELLDTCIGFLDAGSSMEATARAMFIHPNTVRYRLRRIQDVTGYNPTDAREAYVLRLAITLGRLQE
ncbi:PucR family transcriptional regulator [[Pseudopropionibacterium] massiliense]|uniref:PucR family transcriptional regulator n=1 Tax=[Pseudopropionibacterium] massiliense TaxID=2220000 RepID=UPI001030CA3E|nr:helix-turn-helix domain-containing protein [[Pseudopropionibacterium] massiliense]